MVLNYCRYVGIDQGQEEWQQKHCNGGADLQEEMNRRDEYFQG